MPYYQDTFADLLGRLRRQRPNLDPSVGRDLLIDRLRQVQDKKTFWAGTFRRGTIAIPTMYTTGVVTMTQFSNLITGTGTNWPVNDRVNVTFPGNVRTGDQWVAPSNMTGIDKNTVLYVDATGPNPEIVPVMDVTTGKIRVTFMYDHNAGFTGTESSLAGRQLRIGTTNPIFTVNAFTSATSAILDNPWGAATLTGASYQLIRMYTVVGDDVKELIAAADPFQQIRLALHIPQTALNAVDPNRQMMDNPVCLADLGPNLNGNMLYEIWPPQTTARQLYIMYWQKWPDFKFPYDRPPSFLNPSLLIYGALADAFRTPCPVPAGPQGQMSDPFMNLQAADRFELKFQEALQDAVVADSSIAQTAVTAVWDSWPYATMGANWNQAHAVTADGESLFPY